MPSKVAVTEDGPYVVSGGLPVRRVRDVESEHGEPMTTRTTQRLTVNDSYALCRCGQSSNKPFCDNSHYTTDWDGTEAAPVDRYDERARVFEAPGVVMRDDRSLCEHAGFCTNQVTNAWKLMKEQATEDTLVRAQLITMVERCPSGALTYRLPGEDEDIEPELPVAIAVVDDGPLLVTGGVTVERADGKPFEIRNRVALCRCGGSANKPLCDGSHRKNGFRDAGPNAGTGSTSS